ncbi:MAG: DJ-1/PfpI family protein [Pseudoflavonifractor sp.]
MIYLLLGEGFEEAEALVAADLLRRGGAEVSLVALENRSVTGSHGIAVTADLTLDQVDEDAMEMLVIPGGLGGVASIQMNLFALALIQRAYDKGCWLGAICAGPTVLANMGFADRRKAVCYPGMEDQMGSAIVQVGAPVVADGRLITGQALGSVFEFSLCLLEAIKGRAAAQKVRDEIHFHG